VRHRFEDYLLDPERRELTRGAQAVPLGPQVFDLLLHLVRNRGHVVSKDDLLDSVWGGRTVSESTLTSHINAARRAVGDNGKDQRLIRTIARKGFRFVGDAVDIDLPDHDDRGKAEPAGATEEPAEALPLPDKPSIAVLPFLNLSGDPEQEYFIDGVVEDIISALSRIGWLFVIARNSSFTYKGRSVDVKQVGRELGVRYVLEGSMRKSASLVRITGQLIDAATGGHLWAERFEGTLDDIFELQDQVTESVVGAIAPQLERAQSERARQKPTGSLGAYDYYLRGVRSLHLMTREEVDEALGLFQSAIDLDPDFAAAYAMAAWAHVWRKVNGWMIDRPREVAEGARLARRAVELGRNDAVALARGGHALGHFGGDLDSCIALIERALVLNPNLSAAWYLGGVQRVSLGEHDQASEDFEHAMRLSPLDPEMGRMLAGMAMGHFFKKRFELALSWAERASRDLPDFLAVGGIIAASRALAGDDGEARRAAEHLQGLDPTVRIASFKDWILLRRAEDLALLEDGLRKAGLPE
jgi:TolB-like protein/Tfp pilus assembly protein PilF